MVRKAGPLIVIAGIVIVVAGVRVCAGTPQDLVLSKSSRLGNNHREVNPAAGSSNASSPPQQVICHQARRSLECRRTTGDISTTGGRPRQEQTRSYYR